MINQILCFLLQSVAGVVIGFSMDVMLPIKKKAPPKWARVGLWSLLYVVMNANRMFIQVTPFPVDFFGMFLTVVMALVSFLFFYDGSIKRKIMAFVLLALSVTTAELVMSVIVSVFHLPNPSADFSKTDMVMVSLIGCIASNLTMYFVVLLWQKLKMKKQTVRGSWSLVGMLLCLTFPTFMYAVDVFVNGSEISPLHVISMLFAVVFGLLLIFVQFNLSEKDEIEKELNELKHISELEHQHYESVELRREEMAKIRHDYNNILSSVLSLLHMEKIPEAEETVKSLLIKIEQTREMEYCEIPIVNAILSEKEAECRRNNIKLSVDLLFPGDISVSYIDLCSVFSNLLDNAIRACNHFTQEENKRIDLTVRTQGGYVLVRCDNPSLKAPGAQPEGTGYGMKILNDIAKRYGGEFKSSFKDGVFTARLVMLAE